MSELLLRADYAWLKARGWVAMPWRNRPYEKRYGEGEYTEREWRRGRESIYESPSCLWRRNDRGCSEVQGLFDVREKGQLALDME